MKITEFEIRHQRLLHQIVVGLAFSTYLFDRDDIVWSLVKDSGAAKDWERALFALATVLIGMAAVLCIRARAQSAPTTFASSTRHVGDLLYAVGLGTLAPWLGFVILTGGEALRVFRLSQLEGERRQEERSLWQVTPRPHNWLKAFRLEIIKWEIFLTMIIFTITLQDRIAETLAVASFLVSLVVNWNESLHGAEAVPRSAP